MNNTDAGKIRDLPSRSKLVEEIKTLSTVRAIALFLEKFGIKNQNLMETLERIPELASQLEDLIDVPDKFNEQFSERGWIAYESMNSDLMKRVTELAEQGDIESAEQLLVDSYEEKSIRQRLKMMCFIEEFRPRERLLLKALDDYVAERYHACIPVVLANIDGLVNDITRQKGFFAEGTDLIAWDSIAAHSSGLQTLAEILGKGRCKTTTETITLPYRNGILHGRDLGYDNKMVAAKSWAALFALRDWIIAVRKDVPEPKTTPSLLESLQNFREHQAETTRIKTWQPRIVQPSVGFPVQGESSEYAEASPERALVEFLTMWMNRNYGKMTMCLCSVHQQGSVNKTAGWLRNLFREIEIKSYEILSVEDKTFSASIINIRLVYCKEGQQLSKTYDVRMLYEDNSGNFLTAGNPKGHWQVLITPFIGSF